MKTILLILFMTCGLLAQAQTPAGGDASDSASKDEILRRAVRDAIAAAENANAAASATPTNSGAAAPARSVTNTASAAPTNAMAADSTAAGSNAPAAPSAQDSRTRSHKFVRPGRNGIATNAPGLVPTGGVSNSAVAGAATGNVAPQAAAVAPAPVPVPVAMPVPAPVPVAMPPPPAVMPAAVAAAPQMSPPFMPPVNRAQATAIPTIPAVPTTTTPPATTIPPPPPRPGERLQESVIPAGEINFPATDVNQVLEIYADLVGRTILRPTALPAQMITLKTKTPLTRQEAIQALDTVLAMNGITMINVGDKFVKAVPVGQAFQEANEVSTLDKGQLPEADQYVTHIVQVKYAKPSELVPILQGFAKIPNSVLPIDSSGILVIRDYAANVKRMLELIDQIDVTVPLDYESEVIPIKYALASDIASALGSLGGGSGTSIGHSASAPRTGTAGGIGGIGGAGGIGSPGGLGTPGSLNTPGYQQGGLGTPGGGATAPGGARTTSFQDRLRSLVQHAANAGDFQVLGQTKIIADERTNSLLVFASKQDMEMIKSIISKLDVVLAQVLIEAIIMEVTLSDDQSLGISYLQNSPSKPGNYFSGIGAIKNGSFLSKNNFFGLATNAAGGLPSGFSYAANFGNDFSATLTALAEDHKINVLSRPRIQTSHAVPASLQIGDTVPYVTGTYFNGVNGTPSSQYQQTFVGINLQVTPLINPDGLVVMDITQDIQQLGTSVTIDNNPVPTTTKRTAQAKVSVRDGDTIMLGGFISTTKSKDKSGVPILKDIPGLGYLFRSTSDSSKRVELVVLIKPTVLPNPEMAAIASRNVERSMPAVRTAEAEYEADEAKRMKAADRALGTSNPGDAQKQ